MHDPIVRKLVAELDAMLIDAPAASAPWLVAKVTVYDKNKKERDKFDQAGWLVKQDGDKRTLFTPWGTLETVRKSAELTRDNDRENWRTCSIAERRINRWAAGRVGRTGQELRWEALEDSLLAGEEWSRVMAGRVEWLLEHKDDRAYNVMRRMLESGKTEAYDKATILGMYMEHDPASQRPGGRVPGGQE